MASYSVPSYSVWLFAFLFVISPTATRADDGQTAAWPQWRGPTRDGLTKATDWPESLNASTLQKTWRIPLGPSYSGPIVSEDRVFVTETKDEQYEIVRALDRGTGEQIWATQWEGAMKVPFFARSNGDWIRATPAYDGQRLYVAGMRDVLVCLDAESGKQIWKVDFVKQVGSPLPNFGFVSSPLVLGNHVFVQAAASVTKLDKLTGDIVWRSLKDSGGMNGSAFSSPLVATLNGTQQLVVQTRSELAGVDLNSGTELWSQEIPAFRGMNILTPTVVNDTIFTSSYGGRTFLFQTQQGEGSLRVSEMWNNKSQGYMSSPVVIDNHVYLHLRNQRFTCIDLSDGQTKWTTKPFGKYWSLVAAGKRILALDERGELLLIHANPEEFELIDRRQISDDPTWAHLAVCQGEVFVRELYGLRAFRWANDSGAVVSAASPGE